MSAARGAPALASKAFEPGGRIPEEHTCEGAGANASPPLEFSGLPSKARTVCLVMDDPDAPAGTWVHWLLYDWPASRASIPGGLPKDPELANGAKQGACWGTASFSRVGYQGPCPPPGKPHRYSFRLYALDGPLGLPPRATKKDIMAAMEGRVLAQAELVGVFGR